MGVAGVPAGGPAGAPAGTKAGNTAGQKRTISLSDLDLAGVAAGVQNNLGTVPVTDSPSQGVSSQSSTLSTHQLKIDSVRFIVRGLRDKTNTASSATFQVIANLGEAGGRNAVDVLDTRNRGFAGHAGADGITDAEAGVAARAGDLEVSNPGATIEVNPVGVKELVGRTPHTFSVAMRGGSIHTATLTTEIDLVHGD